MSQIVNSVVYEGGRRIGAVDLTQPHCTEPADNRFVWIGLEEPDQSLLRTVQLRFGLHDLAVEDALVAHQRPKLEIYGESLFIVLRTAQLQDGKIRYGETHIFAGKGYVVTVRHGSATPYTDVRTRCEAAPKMLSMGESFVVYSIMDFIVDRYFPVIHELESEGDALEDAVFSHASGRREIERIYELRHELMLLRRAVQPLEEVCARIMRFDAPVADDSMRPYFRDVQDHVIRVVESIDNLRDLVTAALEANLLLSTAQQNEVTKRLAGWAAILAVPTAIAGIYGMNFKWMPELEQPWGYPSVMAFMAGLCGYIYYRLRRAGWI
jgi:magnesium transporter